MCLFAKKLHYPGIWLGVIFENINVTYCIAVASDLLPAAVLHMKETATGYIQIPCILVPSAILVVWYTCN